MEHKFECFQPPQQKITSLENAMVELANYMAEMENSHPQEKKLNLEEAMVELAKS